MPRRSTRVVIPIDDENPEWTAADFARAKRGDDIPAPIRAAFGPKRGRPVGSTSSTKTAVTLRIDNDVLAKFRESGPGWQTRMNDALRRASRSIAR